MKNLIRLAGCLRDKRLFQPPPLTAVQKELRSLRSLRLCGEKISSGGDTMTPSSDNFL
jgi:hypothetical protein